MKGCYLIHFDKPVRGAQRHYIGWSSDLRRRAYEHLCGKGSELTRIAQLEGFEIRIARFWFDVGKDVELKLKRRGAKSLCPYCHLETVDRLMYDSDLGDDMPA